MKTVPMKTDLLRNVVLLILVAAGVAHAQRRLTEEPSERVREEVFEAEEVRGRGATAGEVEAVRQATPLPTLVRVRTDFRRELLQSAESF